MKTIQMTIDDAVLHQHKINQWDKQDQQGYVHIPQQLAEIEAWLLEQEWGDDDLWN